MAGDVYLTGITTTGTPHIGNYVGAIRPCIEASRDAANKNYYFLADLHALAKAEDPDRIARSTLEVAAAWLALGLDTDTAVFYRQSDIPEIPELTWILTSVTAKGLMNRAHSYKAQVQANEESGSRDPDKGINMALYSYPILMAADILMFKSTKVPVGRDQKQHVEMTRDIAQRFNHHYGDLLVVPEAVIDDDTAVLSGLDGRKMSKSYDNTIPLFADEKPSTQTHHEDQDQQPGARRTEGDGRLDTLRHLPRVRDAGRNGEYRATLCGGSRLGGDEAGFVRIH